MQSSNGKWQSKDPGSSARSPIRADFLYWAQHVLTRSGQSPADHHRALIAALQDVGEGTTTRLMVLMPPGSAKSTYASVLFPAWWLANRPNSSIIAVSHTAALAGHFGGRVRELIAEHDSCLGCTLRPDHRAAARWQMEAGGNYIATGVRGGVIGRRADLVLIDDPIKSHAEADSAAHREHLWSWYCSDLLTRLKPGAPVVLIMTRWHKDDLCGRLLATQPAQWRVLRLPALAEDNDELCRSSDTPLWPDWENAEALASKRVELGERAWFAMFQQAPRSTEGGLFDITRIAVHDEAPVPSRAVRAWDLAATAACAGTDPDWTVGLKLQRDEAGRFTVVDVVRLRGTPHMVEQAIVNTAAQDGRNVTISIPQDPGQAGKAQTAWLTGCLAGYTLFASPESGAKTTRAAPASAQIEAGNFSVVRASWNHNFFQELRDFPTGNKDDQVDALSRAFAEITRPVTPARRLPVPMMVR